MDSFTMFRRPEPRIARLALFCLLAAGLVAVLQAPWNDAPRLPDVFYEMTGPA